MKAIPKPSWYVTYWRDNAANITDVQIQKWREETDKYNEEIHKLATEYNKNWKQLIALAKELYGERSKEVSYLNAHGPDPCYRLDYDFEKIIEDAKKEAEKNQQKLTEELKAREHLAQAILWLSERGKKLGEDYSATNAVQVANEIAFNEKVEEMKKSGGYILFSGDDDCENCEGWDMQNNRCSCGNRRVSWATDWRFSFLDPVIYAEAN